MSADPNGYLGAVEKITILGFKCMDCDELAVPNDREIKFWSILTRKLEEFPLCAKHALDYPPTAIIESHERLNGKDADQ